VEKSPGRFSDALTYNRRPVLRQAVSQPPVSTGDHEAGALFRMPSAEKSPGLFLPVIDPAGALELAEAGYCIGARLFFSLEQAAHQRPIVP